MIIRIINVFGLAFLGYLDEEINIGDKSSIDINTNLINLRNPRPQGVGMDMRGFALMASCVFKNLRCVAKIGIKATSFGCGQSDFSKFFTAESRLLVVGLFN